MSNDSKLVICLVIYLVVGCYADRTQATEPNSKGSPLVLAAYHGDVSTLIRLLKAGVPIDEKFEGPAHVFADEHGGYPATGSQWTALHAAVANEQDSVASYLIGRGATIDTKGVRGYTPLYRIADRPQLDDQGLALAKLLILSGAKVNARTEFSTFLSHGQTPLHRAEERGHLKLVRMLLDAGASDGIRDVRGRRPRDLRSSSDAGVFDSVDKEEEE